MLSSASIKMDLFWNLQKLQGNRDFHTVKVAHDLIKQKRDQEAALRREAKNLMESGKGKHRVAGPVWKRSH